jgi:hypothetical protein
MNTEETVEQEAEEYRLTYAAAKKNPEGFRALTGLSVEEFEELLHEIAAEYEEAEEERLARSDRQRQRGAGGQFRLSLCDRLLLTLTWLRVYVSYAALGLLFGLDKSNICRNVRMMLPLVQRRTEEALLAEGSEEGKEDLETILERYPELRAILDATEQRVERPQQDATQKEHYSGKKKAHTLKTQIVVNAQGRIQHVSESVPGAKHDVVLARESEVTEEVPSEVALEGDKGYQGLEGKDPQREVKTPYKKPRGGELTEEQKLFNRVFNRGRVIVEHALAHLKVFQVLKQVYRHRRAQHNTIFRIIAGLVNRRLDRRLAAAAAAA